MSRGWRGILIWRSREATTSGLSVRAGANDVPLCDVWVVQEALCLLLLPKRVQAVSGFGMAQAIAAVRWHRSGPLPGVRSANGGHGAGFQAAPAEGQGTLGGRRIPLQTRL